jgi:hypothetical protein
MTDHEFITMRLREDQRRHRPSAAGGRIGRTDRRSGLAKLWPAVAGIALLCALLAGCGGKSDTPANRHESGALPSATTTDTLAGGKRLDDCEYANALVRAMERFTATVPPFGTSSVVGADGVIRSLNDFDGELASLAAELRGYQLGADIAPVNDGVVRVFDDTRRQLPELRSAVESGDVSRLTSAATILTGEVFPRLDSIQSENKAAFDRLNRCARARG